MGAAKLKKQEEACEILSSGAGCQSVGGLVCGSLWTSATGFQQLGAQDLSALPQGIVVEQRCGGCVMGDMAVGNTAGPLR